MKPLIPAPKTSILFIRYVPHPGLSPNVFVLQYELYHNHKQKAMSVSVKFTD